MDTSSSITEAQKVARAALLTGIRISSVHTDMSDLPTPPEDGLLEFQQSCDLAVKHRAEATFQVEMLCTVETSLLIEAQRSPLTTIRVGFIADYDGINATFTDGELRSFAQLNAIWQIWPYYREFVHSLSTRMGLPPLLLPLLRPPGTAAPRE